MDRHRRSGRRYANRIARGTLLALQEVMGKNGLISVLQMAGLPHLIDHFPPDNLIQEFDFGDYSAVFQALEELYGATGGHGLALRAGRSMFPITIKLFNSLPEINDLVVQTVPLSSKIRLGTMTLARIINENSDQRATIHETGENLIYSVHHCAVCWARINLSKPVCYLTTGFIKEGLKWISGGREFKVIETHCLAASAEVCQFVIPKEPMSS